MSLSEVFTTEELDEMNRQRQGLVTLDVALGIVDDDAPDGAYFAQLEELTGMDAGDVATELARRQGR